MFLSKEKERGVLINFYKLKVVDGDLKVIRNWVMTGRPLVLWWGKKKKEKNTTKLPSTAIAIRATTIALGCSSYVWKET